MRVPAVSDICGDITVACAPPPTATGRSRNSPVAEFSAGKD
jgi:hypothetical protein